MAVLTSEIKFYLSGGGANSDPSASLGGAISTTEVVAATLWDDVASSEALAGDTEYRCIYVKNTNATDTWLAVKLWLSANTPSGDSTTAIGLGTAAISGTEQTVDNESTAPSGVTFSAPATQELGLSIGNLTAWQYKAIWWRRTITASASAYSADGATITVGGDTGA